MLLFEMSSWWSNQTREMTLTGGWKITINLKLKNQPKKAKVCL